MSTTPQTPNDDISQTLDQYYAQQDEQNNRQLMQSISAAAGKNADIEGEAQRLGFETGVGPDIARRNMDEVRRRAQIIDAQNRQLTASSPILARQLSDPSFAAIAHDQLDNLSTTEKLFNWVKSAPSAIMQMPSDIMDQWATGQLGYEKNMLGWKARSGKATADDWNRIAEINQQLKTLGPNKTWAGSLSNFAGQFAPTVEHGVVVGSEAGLATGTVAAVAGAVTGPGDLAIAPGAALTGFGAGFHSVMAAEGIQQAAGQSYLDMIDKGIDKQTALVASSGVGLINGVLQQGVLHLIGKPIGEAVSNSLSSAISDKLAVQLVRPTVGRAVSQAVFGLAGRSGAGGVDMAAQEFVTQMGQDLASSYDKGKLETALQTPEGRDELATHMVSAFMNGVLITGTMGGFGTMIGLHSDMARAAEADRSAKFFTALSENAADSKVRERNPNSYESFIASQADGSGAENTYIDGQKMAEVLHQTGVDPAVVEKAVPGFSRQLVDAQATGGDVEIPTARFASRIAGTDLGNAMTPHLRLDPDAMSVAEAKDFYAQVQQMQTEAKLNAADRMAHDVAFTQSSKNVEDSIFEQLKATKALPDDAARTNAQAQASMVSALANRTGQTPEGFYAEHGAEILKAPRGGLAQGANLNLGGEEGEQLNQASRTTSTRGGFDPITRNILLGDKSDFSTFAHETAHWYLSTLSELAQDPKAYPAIKGDMDTLLKWFGTTGDQWKQWDDELKQSGKINPEQAKFHEQFAYSFEKYVADGKAPTEELQGVFNRFARWLKQTYGSVKDNINAIYKKQHGVELPDASNEVTQVMDRMMASDSQIRQAEAERHMEPVYKAKPESMDDNEWAAYQQLGREASEQASEKLTASSIRQMQWLSNAKSKMLMELQAQHDALRAETREQIAEEVRKDPVRQAQEFLKNGKMTTPDGDEVEVPDHHKLDKDAVDSMFPESALGERPELSKLRGLTAKEGGIHPDLAAEMFGFDNGHHMLRNIIDAKPLDDEIDARTDQRMLDENGNLNDPESMNREVEQALHNEARQRFVAVELRHARQTMTPVRILTKAADAAAQRMIAEQPIGEINPREYSVGATKAARDAEAAMRKGDSAGVAKAKQKQLMQGALAKAAIAARDEVQSTLKYLGKFDRPKLAMTKAIGADYMDRINELLAGYQLSTREPLGSGREDISSWVRSEYDKNGIMPAVSDDIMASMGQMHWKQMNLGQLHDLNDAVKSLDFVGRRSKVIEIDGQLRAVDDVINQVRERMAGVKHTAPVDLREDMAHATGLNKIAAQFLNLKSKVRGIDAALLKMEQFMQWLDAGKDAGLKEAGVDGPMQKNVFQLASNAEGRERAMRAASADALRDIAEKHLQGSKINLNEALDVPELPRKGQGSRMYRETLLAVALNMGNESNQEKLLDGYQWTQGQVMSAINRLLSKPEMDFVQGVWDHIGSYAGEISDLHRRQTGVPLKMIDPTMLATEHGVYKGGYFPVVYDDFQDRNIEMKNARNADKLFENNYANPMTAKGHTIDRTGYTGPLYLSLGVIARHLDQVTHDLAWREPIGDMNKVLSHDGLHDEVDQTYGREYSKQLRPWLQAMANDKVFNTAGDSALEKFYRGARSNATMVGLGFRLSTMEIHGLSALSNSIGEVGAKWFAKGAAQFAGFDRIQATRDFVYERSPEMANRMNEMDRNIHEAIDDINRREYGLTAPGAMTKVLDGGRKFAFYGVSMLDMASAMPTWMAGYLKGIAKESDGGLNLSEEDAIENANRAVRNAHGGGGMKDMAAIQRSKGALSLATMFYSFWNHMYQRQRDIGKGIGAMATGQGSVHDMPRLLARSLFYFVVPQMIHAVLKGQSNKDDDGTLAGFTKHLGKEMGLGFVSGVPGLRDLASSYVNGRDYSISPLEQAGKSLVTAAEDATHWVEGERTSKHAWQNAANAAGYTFGIPTSQPAATTKFLWDVVDGDQNPQSAGDWWKGIATGRIR